MMDTKPQAIFRKDYQSPAYLIETTDLDFVLGEEFTVVRARLGMRPGDATGDGPVPLVLHGEELDTIAVSIDGRKLAEDEYTLSDEKLELTPPAGPFILETEVRIKPHENTALSGLYKSSGNFCTQCEAEGFRRITWYLDRPDVMSVFSTTITADPDKYPVLLSNGNRKSDTKLDDGRMQVRWEDPFPKPSYLFALVAGKLSCHAGTFTTCSGREINLEIWVEPQNIDSCEHALHSLQKSMKWDEEMFGLEYDLDVYMIVAVSDFNMGAMENKGLNVFNSKYVLARPDTASDADYEGVEAVIAHEYFHNWTGNRVTCRDWFQLTLKEGLTVFRDQQFTADMTSKAVKRISDVKGLRYAQFSEDAGPMAHPIRPESYIEMNNFYTSTVYSKGAEVIRMVHTLLGEEGFRKGMDLYFERHDGQAVTCDDFRAAMADATGVNLDLFERWYTQAGTPRLTAKGSWDEAEQKYSLTLSQTIEPTPGQEEKLPMHIPVRVGLLGADGSDLESQVAGQASGTEAILELKEAEQTFVFDSVKEAPVPSLLRGFSAPVRLSMERERSELAFLMSHDSDSFNRWEAGQTLARDVLLDLAASASKGSELKLDPLFTEAFGKVLADRDLDGSLKALALGLPGEKVLGQEMKVVAVDALHTARTFVVGELARTHRSTIEELVGETASQGGYANDKASVNRRALHNTALYYLSVLDEDATTARVVSHFETADNMTDSAAALVMLANLERPEREQALQTFYDRWKADPLVLDKWFTVQATSSLPRTLERVRGLLKHADFTLKNPNRVRSLVGAFCMANQVRFHVESGDGYALLGDLVLELDSINPQVTARMVSCFNSWKRFDAGRQQLMKVQLERISGKSGLSKDVFEIVGKALKG